MSDYQEAHIEELERENARLKADAARLDKLGMRLTGIDQSCEAGLAFLVFRNSENRLEFTTATVEDTQRGVAFLGEETDGSKTLCEAIDALPKAEEEEGS